MGLTVFLHLLVAAAPAIAEIDMRFTRYPESVTAPVGDTVTFECAVNVPGERLVWRQRPLDRPDEDWQDVRTKDSDTNKLSTKLVIEITEETVSALYQCAVWYGSVSLVSVPARLTIATVDLSKNTPEKRVITAPLNNIIVLHCKEPVSEPPAVITWWKEDAKKTRTVLETPHGVLVIHNATTVDSGTYGCKATNEISGQTFDLPEKTYLKVQHEGSGGVRFLETEDYVGLKDSDGVLTMPVKPGGVLRLWCGAVNTPPPRVTWQREGKGPLPRKHDYMFVISSFTPEDEGIYSCSANGIRRSWKVVALQPPHWEGAASNANASEGGEAHVSCGISYGQPSPTVYWVLNAEVLKPGKGIRVNNSDLTIERAEKRHAGIVQCFACNLLGCAYDAAMLTIVPLQRPDQDYSAEAPRTMQFAAQLPKRHNRKNPRKHKAVLIPPSRPNVTRISDESVMVTWTNANHGLPIQFFKVQYREVTNTSTLPPWNTATQDIPAHVHSYEIEGLAPEKYYKFRIAAVYSNQDNNQGRSSARFYLQRAASGRFPVPATPVLVRATAVSPHTIQLNWMWSSTNGMEVEGFYIYYRAVSSAGAYDKVNAPGASARTLLLSHLTPDTAYELKIVAYTVHAISDFSTILVSKTQPSATSASPTTTVPESRSPGSSTEEAKAPSTLLTAGGALGAAALVVILVVTLLLCRRAKRPSANKEKGTVPETGGANGYIPAKVPITITANPMHSEGADAGVEMSFLHNNNTGNNDDTLPHSRKNGPARQYV